MESVRVAYTPEGKLRAYSADKELDLVKGLAPPELLGISLGGCIAILVGSFISRRGLDASGISVSVLMEHAENPPRIGKIEVAVCAPGVTSEAERLAVERVAHHCYIHNTLMNPPEIRISLGS